MNRFMASLRWRQTRWVALAVLVPALWACNARRLGVPNAMPAQVEQKRFVQSVNRDLDMVFMIDNSKSMAPLQAKLMQRLPDFMTVLQGLPGGLPNVHIGVISSSLGAGIYGDVPGCGQGAPGNDNGAFQHLGTCTGLNAGSTFIVSDQGTTNFTGNISDVFSCIAVLGDGGCGFEHQFASTEVALMRAKNPMDADNGSFLRDSAYLAVVMVTNEDDCSVPGDSDLFNPAQSMVSDPYGGLQSYRCNEFGHLCDGQAPPHNPPAMPTPLANCESNESGKLIRVAEFVNYLKSLKDDPNKVFVAAIAGSPTPYTVGFESKQLPNGGTENQPVIQHSCTQGMDYADPAVRIAQAVTAFGQNGVFEDICANDFRPALQQIAMEIGRVLGPQCLNGAIMQTPAGTPDCQVAERSYSATGAAVDKPIPPCDANRGNTDCWELQDGANCPNGKVLQICRDAACDPNNRPMDQRNALVSCAIGL